MQVTRGQRKGERGETRERRERETVVSFDTYNLSDTRNCCVSNFSAKGSVDDLIDVDDIDLCRNHDDFLLQLSTRLLSCLSSSRERVMSK